jgi:hypothetical protein
MPIPGTIESTADFYQRGDISRFTVPLHHETDAVAKSERCLRRRGGGEVGRVVKEAVQEICVAVKVYSVFSMPQDSS